MFNSQFPKEQSFNNITKQESKSLNKTWDIGAYNFFLRRTLSFAHQSKSNQSRNEISSIINQPLPIVDDLVLESLYTKVLSEYQSNLSNKKSSGFDITSYEYGFLKSFKKIQQNNPKLKNVLIYPSFNSYRMAIGPYIPDFLLVGLSVKGSSLLSIEVNGGCHIDKLEKDFSKDDRLRKLDIYTIPIQNPQTADLDFLSKLFNDPKILNITDRPEQIKRVLRRIWVKTIVNNWTLERIESELFMATKKDFNLIKEFLNVVKRKDCPRKIKKEFKSWKIPR